ncbi:RNP-1 like RNA-binding protein [Syntrophobacter sp. SbD1]|nr:RNP-1 like RNA-binding protein [Syntrophobacter sp. SbD1]
MNIFVGSLSFKTTEEELRKEFEAFGEVDSVKIILDHETLKSRGFAFVTMSGQDQATAAIAGLNGKEINGFALKINEARPRDSSGGPPRARSGAGSGDSNRGGGSGYGGFASRPASFGYNKDRTGGGGNSSTNDSDIYDTKAGRSGSRKGKGGGSRGSGGPGGRSGGGRRSY